jgi:hypothetical protein
MGARSKCGGTTGRCAKLHLPRLTSYSSGALISTRWPTAEVTTQRSFSKWSAPFSNLPLAGVSARTMSCATLGFSAMMTVLPMCPVSAELRPAARGPLPRIVTLARTHARPYDFNVQNEEMGKPSMRPQGGAASRSGARACMARASSPCRPSRPASASSNTPAHHQLEEAQRLPPARPRRPEPHLLLPHRRRSRHRRQGGRQRVALDQPRLRAQLHRRRGRRPRLHQARCATCSPERSCSTTTG